MKKLLILIACLLLLSGSSSAQENYCHDPKTWEDWDKIVRKYPDDVPLQILHALRVGLCVKVENGSITINEATNLIDEWSESLIQGRREKELQAKGKDL